MESAILREVKVGDRRYRLRATGRDANWTADAEDLETGDRFGMECAGENESAALDRLSAWLTWQHEHAAALDALQQAERAYHRTIAGSAFANPTEGPTPIELQRESLEAVEAARLRLDEVRARRP
jgi:hypothetical protein